ncbi:MAG: ABC transporter ATP-binding protein [Casimicrobiaceae bacterium]
MSEPALRLAGIEKRYGATVAVARVDLEVGEGEFVTLLGPSGCGKTTTLGLIAGFFPPTRGEIYLKGRPVAKLPPFRRDIGVVFQDYALFPHMTAGENVAFGLKMRDLEKAEIGQRVREALDLVQLAGLSERRPLELSGGQRQRVALARALVIRPTVLLLDEPLSNLDLKLREEMRVEIAGLQRRLGITTVFVTHDQGEALVMSDRIAVMNAGRIEQVGRPAEIYERPATRFVAEFIGRMNFFVRDDQILAIRPERAKLATELPKTGFAVRGTVRQVLYLGATLEYHLALDNGERALVEAQNDGNADGKAPRFAAGSVVWFTAPAESCFGMPVP